MLKCLGSIGLGALVALVWLGGAAAEETPPAEGTTEGLPRRIDPRADELLRKASELLARTPRFALEAEETFDEVSDSAPRVQLTNVRRIAVVRPSRFAADATGDTSTGRPGTTGRHSRSSTRAVTSTCASTRPETSTASSTRWTTSTAS